MFSNMSDRDLLNFCWERFCDYDVCKALKCESLCKDEDCPLAQLFERFDSRLKMERWGRHGKADCGAGLLLEGLG